MRVGPGVAGLMLPIAMVIAVENKFSVVMMAIMVIAGALAGGLSPASVSGLVASKLALEQGVTNYMPIYIPYICLMVSEALIAYFIFGGFKIKKADIDSECPEK